MRARTNIIIIAFAVILSAVAAINAQDVPTDAPQQEPRPTRPNLFRLLELTPEQLAEIKKYNDENKEARQEANRRLRETNRELDQAIYGEKVEDSVVEEKLKNYQDAQAEVARLRFQGELALRKLLTADQLVRFLELRHRFAEQRQRMQQQRQEMPQRPFRRMNRRPEQKPPSI